MLSILSTLRGSTQAAFGARLGWLCGSGGRRFLTTKAVSRKGGRRSEEATGSLWVGRGSGRRDSKAGRRAVWWACEDLRDRAAAAVGGGVVDVGGGYGRDDWRGRVFWRRPGGVLKESDAVFRQALLSSGLEAVAVFSRCSVEDAWAQELLGSPRLSVLPFGAGTGRGGAVGWAAAERSVGSCCGASMSVRKRSRRPWSRWAPWFGSGG